MKQNFTSTEISTLVITFGSKFQISVNRAGNIKIVDPNEPIKHLYWGCAKRGFWTFYHNENGYLIRRMDGNGYCYPLNMTGRKNDTTHRPFIWVDGNGHTHKEYYRPYDINNSYFSTFDEVLEYFINYLKKYRNITIK